MEHLLEIIINTEFKIKVMKIMTRNTQKAKATIKANHENKTASSKGFK
jgi:hypothetical protein